VASARERAIDQATDWQKVQNEIARTLPQVQNVANPNVKVPTLAQLSGNAAAGAGTFGNTAGMTVAQQAGQNPNLINWRDYFVTVLRGWGLETLAPKVIDFVNQGFIGDTILLKLQETPEYKTRFSGNEARIKAGLAPLDPQTYLGLENSYRSILRNAGVPQGFYDTADDFSTFIANDVAPAELKQRTDIAELSLNGADSFYTNSLQQMYGITKGDMLAYVLDPQRALPFINRQVQAAQFGAEAARQGLQATTPMAETYAGLGVTQQQARQGFEQVAQILPEAQRLSQITAGAKPVGFEEVTSAVLGGEQSAAYKKQLQDLAQQEKSRFAGQAGVGRGSLSRGMSGQI
jgi:hypothetical protein